MWPALQQWLQRPIDPVVVPSGELEGIESPLLFVGGASSNPVTSCSGALLSPATTGNSGANGTTGTGGSAASAAGGGGGGFGGGQGGQLVSVAQEMMEDGGAGSSFAGGVSDYVPTTITTTTTVHSTRGISSSVTPDLAVTGLDVYPLFMAGGGLIVGGSVLLGATSRRRRKRATFTT
jgi:hypothetical protein